MLMGMARLRLRARDRFDVLAMRKASMLLGSSGRTIYSWDGLAKAITMLSLSMEQGG